MLHLNPPIGNGPSDLVYPGQCFDCLVAAQVFRLIHITFAAKRSKWTACGTGRSLRRKGYPLSFNYSADRSHRSPFCSNWSPKVPCLRTERFERNRNLKESKTPGFSAKSNQIWRPSCIQQRSRICRKPQFPKTSTGDWIPSSEGSNFEQDRYIGPSKSTEPSRMALPRDSFAFDHRGTIIKLKPDSGPEALCISCWSDHGSLVALSTGAPTCLVCGLFIKLDHEVWKGSPSALV